MVMVARMLWFLAVSCNGGNESCKKTGVFGESSAVANMAFPFQAADHMVKSSSES